MVLDLKGIIPKWPIKRALIPVVAYCAYKCYEAICLFSCFDSPLSNDVLAVQG